MNRKIPDQLRKQLSEFFQQQSQVAAVYIFGSYGTEYQHPKSDIDLGIVFSFPILLSDEIVIDGNLSLHVASDREIDFVNLNNAPVPLQFRALREGLLIYEGNYIKHSEFIEQVLKANFEYQLRHPEFKYLSEQEVGHIG